MPFTDHFPAATLIDVLSETPALQELSLLDECHTETGAIDSLLERLSLTPVGQLEVKMAYFFLVFEASNTQDTFLLCSVSRHLSSQ
jgi:hypothetical protein